MNTKHILKAAAGLFILAGSVSANATPISMGCISATDLSGTGCAVADSAMSVDVTDSGSGTISFTFSNNTSSTAFIADIYLYDGSYISPTLVSSSSTGTVSFSSPASPGALPGYSGSSSVTYSMDSDPSVSLNGIGDGESLTLTFDLLSGVTYNDALSALQSADGSFMVGLHVQGIDTSACTATGGTCSVSMISTVPVPAAAWLFGTGLLGLVGVARRKSA